MPDRLVRFRQSFFDDLDRQLPDERTAGGVPSAADFLVYDLPPMRDLLASSFEQSTVTVSGAPGMAVHLGKGTLVRAVAVYARLLADDCVEVVGLEIDLGDHFDDLDQPDDD